VTPRRRASLSLSPTRASGGHEEADALPRPPLHPEYLGREKYLDPFVTENSPHCVRDVRILATEELRSVLDHRHAAPEATVSLGKFEADIPTAEDDQVLGHTIEIEHLDMRERPGSH